MSHNIVVFNIFFHSKAYELSLLPTDWELPIKGVITRGIAIIQCILTNYISSA